MEAYTHRNKKFGDRNIDERAGVCSEDGEVHANTGMAKDVHPLPAGVSGQIAVIDFRTTLNGKVAVTSYRADEHENYHGHQLHCYYRSTDTWIQTPNGWRLIASQVVAERGDPPSIHISDSQADAYVGRYALTPEIAY